MITELQAVAVEVMQEYQEFTDQELQQCQNAIGVTNEQHSTSNEDSDIMRKYIANSKKERELKQKLQQMYQKLMMRWTGGPYKNIDENSS